MPGDELKYEDVKDHEGRSLVASNYPVRLWSIHIDGESYYSVTVNGVEAARSKGLKSTVDIFNKEVAK